MVSTLLRPHLTSPPVPRYQQCHPDNQGSPGPRAAADIFERLTDRSLRLPGNVEKKNGTKNKKPG